VYFIPYAIVGLLAMECGCSYFNCLLPSLSCCLNELCDNDALCSQCSLYNYCGISSCAQQVRCCVHLCKCSLTQEGCMFLLDWPVPQNISVFLCLCKHPVENSASVACKSHEAHLATLHIVYITSLTGDLLSHCIFICS
jgi:hypothetical protein